MKTIEQKLFEYILDNLSLLDIDIDINFDEVDTQIKIYYDNKYCIDLFKKYEEGNYNYEYYSDLFEGFEDITIEDFFKLIKTKKL